MIDKPLLVDIDDLYLKFYTKGGVVHALDGVDLEIFKGETLGLVGESGCGKSVTANSIMRLVPSPPGKIEGGSIYYLQPSALIKAEKELKMKLEHGKISPEEAERQKAELDKERQAFHQLRSQWNELRKLKEEKGSDDPGVVRKAEELAPLMKKYNVLEMPLEDLRKIRGHSISMIFQEPMTSLNPVITAGDQIAEVLLLHERRELAGAILRRMNRDTEAVGVTKTQMSDGEWHCSACSAMVAEAAETCISCGKSFDEGLNNIRFNKGSYRRLMEKVMDDPDSLGLRIMSKIPLLKRYERPLKAEAMSRAVDMLKQVRVPDPAIVASSYPYELSGGMQQSVMIAMALACKPQLLIADEPTTALDVTIQAQILKLMRDLQRDTGTTILLITHNLGGVAETCDRVGVMYAGTMAELAPVETIFSEPLHPYTQGLINAIPRINKDLPRLETIEGAVPNLSKPPSGCRFHPRCPYAMGICRQAKPILQQIEPGHQVACHLYTGGRAQ